MSSSGFGEEKQPPLAQDANALVGQFRRFGEQGPAYEILRVVDEQTVFIHVYTNNEELNYPVSEALADPIADTIP